MFGNLRWSRCGKTADARRLYKAQLCASCHAMRDFSGRPTSLLANYDQSLLVMVLAAVAGDVVEERRCTAVPWRTVAVQDLSPKLRRFVAAGNLALIDAKLRDDIDDGGRWYAKALRFGLRRKTRRAMRELGQQGFSVGLVEELPQRQRQVEALGGVDLPALAEPSAELLGAIFAHGGLLASPESSPEPSPGASSTMLARFGRATARAIYALDALEDHDEDRSKGRFNAIASLAGRLGHEVAVVTARQFVERHVVEARQLAMALLPDDRQSIVGSILQQLAASAGRHAEHLLGRPAAAAMRPAEAGDCDCCGDACCSGCDCSGGDCSGGDGCCNGTGWCGGHSGSSCCDCCLCCDADSSKRRKGAQQEQGQDSGQDPNRPSGMPMQ